MSDNLPAVQNKSSSTPQPARPSSLIERSIGFVSRRFPQRLRKQIVFLLATGGGLLAILMTLTKGLEIGAVVLLVLTAVNQAINATVAVEQHLPISNLDDFDRQYLTTLMDSSVLAAKVTVRRRVTCGEVSTLLRNVASVVRSYYKYVHGNSNVRVNANLMIFHAGDPPNAIRLKFNEPLVPHRMGFLQCVAYAEADSSRSWTSLPVADADCTQHCRCGDRLLPGAPDAIARKKTVYLADTRSIENEFRRNVDQSHRDAIRDYFMDRQRPYFSIASFPLFHDGHRIGVVNMDSDALSMLGEPGSQDFEAIALWLGPYLGLLQAIAACPIEGQPDNWPAKNPAPLSWKRPEGLGAAEV